jgi:hypothetical protein
MSKPYEDPEIDIPMPAKEEFSIDNRSFPPPTIGESRQMYPFNTNPPLIEYGNNKYPPEGSELQNLRRA